MAIIELIGLSKWYGEVIGLNNVTVNIGHGITGLLGPNGAGKSTLMGILTGQLRPSKGVMRVFGRTPWNNPNVLSQIGYCPEGEAFWPNLTGRQFVSFLARLSGLQGNAARQAVDEAIERTGMTAHASRIIRGYSKGMRQRIKIAQALCHNPSLLVLDEPFTGADPVARHDLAKLFRQLASEGVDILISSHILHEVEAITKQILMIDRGRIVAEGNLREVRSQMEDRPHAIRIRLKQPRRLAAALIEMQEVTGFKMVADDILVVETVSPAVVQDRLVEIVVSKRLNVQEIAATDESLEAVFGYLTNRN